MESSINSSCCSESPTVSAEGSRLTRRRMEEENQEKKIMEADLAEARMEEPQLPDSPPSQPSFPGDSLFQPLQENFPIPPPAPPPPAPAPPPPPPPPAYFSNDDTYDSPKERRETLDKIMEALTDPNNHIMGFHCSSENAMEFKVIDLLEKVTRRANRDNMFDVILRATATKKPNIKKIQDEIATGLNLSLVNKSTVERASVLQDNIRMKPRILIIFEKLYEGIDLEKVGIPCGADHSGCKILLTSTREDVLSNQMHTQKNFPV